MKRRVDDVTVRVWAKDARSDAMHVGITANLAADLEDARAENAELRKEIAELKRRA